MHWHGKEMCVEIALINIVNVGVSANNAAHLHWCSFICTPMQLSKRDGRCECVIAIKKATKNQHTHTQNVRRNVVYYYVYLCMYFG